MNPQPQQRVRWGVLGVSSFALDKMIPGIRKGSLGEVAAIASRSLDKARETAQRHGIPRAHGSYEALVADPDIDAVYIPLPNHLHVPWAVRAMEAGKHVLCEKPVACTAAEARTLLDARDRTGKLVQEAAMVRTHPRFLAARDLLRDGAIGEPRSLLGFFAYFNDSPANVRNQPGMGGGGLLDVGFYPVTIARFLFGHEPVRATGALDMDPRFGTDRMASALLDFGGAQAVFTCGTQLFAHQSLTLVGTRGRMEIPTPWSWLDGHPSRLTVATVDGERDYQFPAVDQWGLHAEGFARAILDGGPAPLPIEDAVANLRVLDAIARGAELGRWEAP